MKKLCIGVISVVVCSLAPTTFAAYSLTAADTAAIQAVVQKIQAKPVRVQEAMIMALKKKAPSLKNEKKQALYAALESALRQKTASGDMLATNLERKEIVQALFAQSQAKEVGSATIDLTGTLNSQQEGNLKFDGSVSADVDLQNTKNPKVKLSMDVTAGTTEDSVSVAGEMRVLNKMGYVVLKKFSLIPDDEQLTETLRPYLNIWWEFPIEGETSFDTNTTPVVDNTAQFQKLFTQNNIVPKLLYKGQKNGASLYSGTLDNAAIVELAGQVETIQGNTETATEKAEIQALLKGVVIQTSFSLDAKGKPTAITVTTTLKNKKIEGDTLDGVVTFTITTSSQITPIVAPENSRNIDELSASFM